MSPGHTIKMSTLSLTGSDSTLTVPKLQDNGSNWADYFPRLQVAMESKGLWKHVLGKATSPKPYIEVNGVAVLADGKTPATEEQIDARERRIEDFERASSLAKHVILSTTSSRLGMKLKGHKTAKEMWDTVTKDATSRSTLYLVDAERQLEGMTLAEASDPKTHLTELKSHFDLMMTRYDNIMKMGSTFTENRLITLITASLPKSYRPTLQTIAAADKASRNAALTSQPTSSSQPQQATLAGMTARDLVEFFIEEAEHRVIEDERAKQTESALFTQSGKAKSRKKGKKPDTKCENCKKPGHSKKDCWLPGGDKEGQGPKQEKKKAKGKDKEKTNESAAIANDNDTFAFTCTSTFSADEPGI